MRRKLMRKNLSSRIRNENPDQRRLIGNHSDSVFIKVRNDDGHKQISRLPYSVQSQVESTKFFLKPGAEQDSGSLR